MNTPEKYVCAYIVESMLGIEGSNKERVHEVLQNSDFTIEDPFLNLIYSIAKFDPDSDETKDLVAGLVAAKAANHVDELVERADRKQKELEEAKKKEDELKQSVVLIHSSKDGGHAFTVWFGLRPMAIFFVPEELTDEVIAKFQKKFPEGKVLAG